MICFPNAKINLGLFITEKRQDNYHNIESIFLPIELCDAMEIVENNYFSVKNTGHKVDGNIENNLCVKAYYILKEKYKLPNIKIHLHKNIPFGAGIGGGSANASFMLKLLNEYFSLNISVPELEKYASFIGSDCPFFIKNKPSFVTGRGENIKQIEFNKYDIILIKPDIHISTKEAYSIINPKKALFDLSKLKNSSIEEWKEHINNDFEIAILKKYPIIEQIKNYLYSLGAFYASMSGSGSAVYGLFEKLPDKEIDFLNCFIWKGKTIN